MSAALGESVRTRRVIAAEALARAERAERTREEEARARVDAERIRIAREVHDTVAHAIAIINVQAGVTAHVLGKRPERVRETLVAIEQTSSQALGEMRAILGVLRASSEERVPYPGLAQIGDAAGTTLTLDAAAAFARRGRGRRDRPRAGWDSLTPTELSVVRLVVAGLTNPEIGARLFVSRGTVKAHLGRVYDKLQVANRTELATLATGHLADD